MPSCVLPERFLPAPKFAVYALTLEMFIFSLSSDKENIPQCVRNRKRKYSLSVFICNGMICLKPLFDGVGMGPAFMISVAFLLPIIVWSGLHLYKMHLK